MGVKSSRLVKINQQAGVGAQDILEGLGWRKIDSQIYETRNSVIIKHDHMETIQTNNLLHVFSWGCM